MWATRTGDNYYENSFSIVWSPLINLSGRTNAFLEFYHWYQIESYYDAGWIYIYTPENQTYWYWEDIYYDGNKTYWSNDIYDLSEILDEGLADQLGLLSIPMNQFNIGWYIDDVRVFSML